MRSLARYRIAASLLAIFAAAACSDSTAPRQTAAQIARHFDSLAVQANTQSETNSVYGVRGFLTTLIELPAALGALPSTVTVTTATGSEPWKAYEVLELSPSGSPVDSSYIVLLFRDSDAHTAIVAAFDSAGAIQEAAVVTNDTIFVSPSDGSGTTSLTALGNSCAALSTSLLNPQLGTFTESACNLSTFHTSLQLTNPTTTGMDAALTNVSFSNANVNGVRIVDAASTASVRHVRAMLRAAAAAASKRH